MHSTTSQPPLRRVPIPGARGTARSPIRSAWPRAAHATGRRFIGGRRRGLGTTPRSHRRRCRSAFGACIARAMRRRRRRSDGITRVVPGLRQATRGPRRVAARLERGDIEFARFVRRTESEQRERIGLAALTHDQWHRVLPLRPGHANASISSASSSGTVSALAPNSAL